MANRNKIEIDIDKVQRLASEGLSHAEIAARLGVSEDTIGRRKKQSAVFAEALKRGQSLANAEVSNQLFNLCKSGNLGALVWWEKTRKQYSERTEITGANNGPITVEYVNDWREPTEV